MNAEKKIKRTNISLNHNDFNEAKDATVAVSDKMLKDLQGMLGTRNDLSKLAGIQPDESLGRAARGR